MTLFHGDDKRCDSHRARLIKTLSVVSSARVSSSQNKPRYNLHLLELLNWSSDHAAQIAQIMIKIMKLRKISSHIIPSHKSKNVVDPPIFIFNITALFEEIKHTKSIVLTKTIRPHIKNRTLGTLYSATYEVENKSPHEDHI